MPCEGRQFLISDFGIAELGDFEISGLRDFGIGRFIGWFNPEKSQNLKISKSQNLKIRNQKSAIQKKVSPNQELTLL